MCSESEDGDIYYFNFRTKESSWEHPCDSFYKEMLEREREKIRVSSGPPRTAEKGQKGLVRKGHPRHAKQCATHSHTYVTPAYARSSWIAIHQYTYPHACAISCMCLLALSAYVECEWCLWPMYVVLSVCKTTLCIFISVLCICMPSLYIFPSSHRISYLVLPAC